MILTILIIMFSATVFLRTRDGIITRELQRGALPAMMPYQLGIVGGQECGQKHYQASLAFPSTRNKRHFTRIAVLWHTGTSAALRILEIVLSMSRHGPASGNSGHIPVYKRFLS